MDGTAMTASEALAELLHTLGRRQHEHREHTVNRLAAVTAASVLPEELQHMAFKAAHPDYLQLMKSDPRGAGALLDGELVIWDGARLTFEQLGRRLGRSPAGAAQLALELPAHMVVFACWSKATCTGPASRTRHAGPLWRSCSRRYGIGPPWTLCPATVASDRGTIRT